MQSTPNEDSDGTRNSARADSGLSGWALVIAVVVMAAWLCMLIYLLKNTDATEIVWSRLLLVLSSMEAVAFGAAGALFGTHIQRERVRDASERAERAEKEALVGREMQGKAQALAAAVRASAQRSPAAASPNLSTTAGKAPEVDLLALADQLFPA